MPKLMSLLIFTGLQYVLKSPKYFFHQEWEIWNGDWIRAQASFQEGGRVITRNLGSAFDFPKRSTREKEKKNRANLKWPLPIGQCPMNNINVCLCNKGQSIFYLNSSDFGCTAQEYSLIYFGVCSWIIMWKASLGSRRETPFISSDTPNQLLPSEGIQQYIAGNTIW